MNTSAGEISVFNFLLFWETVAHGYLQPRLRFLRLFRFPFRFVWMFTSCGDQAERKKDQYSWVDFLHQPYWNPTIWHIYIQVEHISHCWVGSNPISGSPHRLFCRVGNAVGSDGWASRAAGYTRCCLFPPLYRFTAYFTIYFFYFHCYFMFIKVIYHLTWHINCGVWTEVEGKGTLPPLEQKLNNGMLTMYNLFIL